ncbi:MAG: hypothetical protein FJX65_08770 [Alphaproteobacteria bacterium]|nr:hypothetical protein [Alphaproteobacteria bacterium]
MTSDTADLIGPPQARARLASARQRPPLRERLRTFFYRGKLYRAWLDRAPLPSIQHALREPWLGRLSTANALFQGRFTFHGHTVQAPNRSPWAVEEPLSWFEALHGFSWLRHFQLASGLTSRQHARELVRSWIHDFGDFEPCAWRAPVLAQRVLAWSIAHEFLLFESDESFRRVFKNSLARQARHLARTAPRVQGQDRLDVAVAVTLVGETMNHGRWARRGRQSVEAALADELLVDGGHRSRNPQRTHAALRTLVTLRDGLASLGVELPSWLPERIEATASVLRLIRHGDGALAIFHGAREDEPQRLDESLRVAESKPRASGSAGDSGFERLTCGRLVAVIDTSSAGPFRSPLAFELSIGRDRLIVNCGCYAGGDEAWARAAESTAAHSTLGIDDRNAECVAASDPLLAQPLRGEEGTSVWLEASHIGYVRRFGLRHRRRLHASKDGYELVGEDSLSLVQSADGRAPAGVDRAANATIRLHLHPGVSASLVRYGKEVLMRLPSGAGWMFEATQGALALEESVYLGQAPEARRTQQIVLTLPIGEAGLDVTWRLARVED